MSNQTNVEQGIITKALGGSVQETKVETPAPPVPDPTMEAQNRSIASLKAIGRDSLAFHSLCTRFPEMAKWEFTDLIASIKVGGLIQPIIIYQSQILDGRSRYLAGQAAGYEFRAVDFVEFSDLALPKPDGTDMTPEEYVLSINCEGRNWKEAAKRAFLSTWPDILAKIQAEAKAHQQAQGGAEPGQPLSEMAAKAVDATESLAKKLTVSTHTSKQLVKIKKYAPDLANNLNPADAEAVKAAYQIANERQEAGEDKRKQVKKEARWAKARRPSPAGLAALTQKAGRLAKSLSIQADYYHGVMVKSGNSCLELDEREHACRLALIDLKEWVETLLAKMEKKSPGTPAPPTIEELAPAEPTLLPVAEMKGALILSDPEFEGVEWDPDFDGAEPDPLYDDALTVLSQNPDATPKTLKNGLGRMSPYRAEKLFQQVAWVLNADDLLEETEEILACA